MYLKHGLAGLAASPEAGLTVSHLETFNLSNPGTGVWAETLTLGAADADRDILFMVGARQMTTPSEDDIDIDIDGGSLATYITGSVANQANSAFVYCYTLALASGTSGTMNVNFTRTDRDLAIAAYRVVGATTYTPVTAILNASHPITLTQNTAAGNLAVGAVTHTFRDANNDLDGNWTGYESEIAEVNPSGFHFATAFHTDLPTETGRTFSNSLNGAPVAGAIAMTNLVIS